MNDRRVAVIREALGVPDGLHFCNHAAQAMGR